MSLAILLLTAPVLGEELVRKGGNSAPYHDWQGHPVHPRFDLTAEVLDFGILIIGEDKEMVVTVTNTSPGNIPLRISLPNDCEGFSLPAIRGKHPLESGRSVEIRVAFSADDPGY